MRRINPRLPRRLPQRIEPRQTVRIVATQVEEHHLKPGDLFSDMGPDYWSVTQTKCGYANVFVKLNNEADFDIGMSPVYRLTIVKMEPDKVEDRNPHVNEAEFSPFTPPGIDYAGWIGKIKWRKE